MYIVYAMHREPEWHGGNSYIGQTYIVKDEEKADVLSEILQKFEKDSEITWEILNMDDAVEVNDVVLDKNNKLIINPAKE
tara:strand:- start:2803 stop:3042 length:240 start_codon:yes stop_codon:yes gene_type:complete